MRRALVWTLSLGVLLAVACAAEVHPTEQPSPTPKYTPTATRTPSPTSEVVASPTATEKPTATSTPEPTATPEAEIPEELLIAPKLTEKEIEAIRYFKDSSENVIKPYLDPLEQGGMQKLDQFVEYLLQQGRISQTEASCLQDLYRNYFLEGGVEKLSRITEEGWRFETDGIGILTRENKDHIGPAIGFLYGFQTIGEDEGTPPYYRVVIQLKPGVYDPRENPEYFHIINVGEHPTDDTVGTRFSFVSLNESDLDVVRKINPKYRRGLADWNIRELKEIFGVIPGSLVFVDTSAVQKDTAYLFTPIALEFPKEGLGKLFVYDED